MARIKLSEKELRSCIRESLLREMAREIRTTEENWRRTEQELRRATEEMGVLRRELRHASEMAEIHPGDPTALQAVLDSAKRLRDASERAKRLAPMVLRAYDSWDAALARAGERRPSASERQSVARRTADIELDAENQAYGINKLMTSVGKPN